MELFDESIISWLNQFAGRWFMLDLFARKAAGMDLLKGGISVAALVWFWCARSADRQRRREIVAATMVAALVGIAVGRALATELPFRERPMLVAGFVAPLGAVGEEPVTDWSSFPSDHALFFATFATGLWFISRRVGAIAMAYLLIVICLPRVYVGLHHPSDIIAGLFLGVGISAIANFEPVRRRLGGTPLRWFEAWPAPAHVLAVLLLIQIGTMFYEGRMLLSAGSKVARIGWCRLISGTGCAVIGERELPRRAQAAPVSTATVDEPGARAASTPTSSANGPR